jgi:hypothetical protein
MKTGVEPSGIIAKTIPFFGLCIRGAVRIPLLGKILGSTNKALGRLLPRLSFLGFQKEASYENAIHNWEIFLKLIGAQYHVEEASPGSRLYTISKCPAGYCRSAHLDACTVTMELDNSLIKRSGARLIVDKRSPLDGICLERLVPQ